MAEVPRPDGGWGLTWSTMKKPPQWGWVKRGERLQPAYTPEDPRLLDPKAVHSQDPTQRQPVAPSKPVPPATPTSQPEFILATSKTLADVPAGQPVVVRRDPSGWVYQSKEGQRGVIPAHQVANAIESQKDEAGKPIKGPDPKALFDIFHKSALGGDDAAPPEPTKNGRPTPESVRLPREHMTEYNKAIESKFTQTPDNIMIDALAGTGKTTMLKHLSSFIKPGEKWLYLVFNKKNQVESKMAFPEGVDVLTTHAFLGQLLKKNGKAVGGQMDLPPQGQKWRKIWKIADNIMPPEWPTPDSDLNYRNKNGEWTSPFHRKAKGLATKLAELSKAYAIMPQDPNVGNQIKEIIVKHGVDMDLSSERVLQDRDYTPDIVQMSVQLLQLSVPGALGNDEMAMFRDQDDTLWFSAMNADNMRWNIGYNVVLMDEVQDFNMCQLIMAKKLKEAGARVVGVGDPNQAMYLFRGADSAAFDKLKGVVGGGQSESLPINFRSGGNIIDWVKNSTHVKNLQAAPHMMGQGRVFADGGTDPPLKYEEFMGEVLKDWGTGRGKLPESTCIISRTNAPLGHAALTLLKNNVNFQIIGKDLSKDLVDLIKKVTWHKPDRQPIDTFADTLASYFGDLEQKWGNKISKRDELKEIGSYIEVLVSVLSHLADTGYREQETSRPMTTAKDLLFYLEKKLSGLDPENEHDAAALKAKDPRSCVMLTTAHKSKGLEWDRTFLMKPSAYNPQGENIKTEEQAQQERNAWYVAATRGKKTLMVSADDAP